MCQLGWSYYQPWLNSPLCSSVRLLPSRLGIPTETGTQCILAARCHQARSRGLFCCQFGSRCVASQKHLLPDRYSDLIVDLRRSSIENRAKNVVAPAGIRVLIRGGTPSEHLLVVLHPFDMPDRYW